MIVGSLNNWENEKGAFGKVIQKGIEYLKNNDFSKMSEGRYKVDDEGMTASVKDNITKHRSEIRPEAHVKYIDIQFVFSGEEMMEYAPLQSEFEVDEDFLAERDVIFFKGVKNGVDLVITQGMFAVFFPTDVHRANCSVNADKPVRKVLVKIPVSALGN